VDTKREKRICLFWRSWVFSILVALFIATSFKSAVADWNIVPTGSMKPTIVEGDRIFVNKLAYDLKLPYTTRHLARWNDPERGDIVVFFSPADDKRLVKRVIGLPGDTIAMRNNGLIINGKALTYERVYPDEIDDKYFIKVLYKYCYKENLFGRKHPVLFTPDRPSLHSFGPVTVPKDFFFMLGDNRDNRADSRYFGFVERDRIVGEATAIVASFNRDYNYLPRWERFFKILP
jgi:signal peptidase I